MTPPQLLALALALVLGRALAAAYEAALAAIGTPHAEQLGRDPAAGVRARALASLAGTPEAASAAIRIWVALTSLGAGALAALAAGGGLASAGAVVASALVTVTFSAAARRLGSRHGEAVALSLAPAVRALRTVLWPLGRALALLAAPLGGGQFSLPRPPLEEIERRLAEYARSHGTSADHSTSELIHKVFEFRDKVARDVMVPRTDVFALDIETPVSDIVRLLAEEGHSRVPVYQGNLDQVVGILHARDLVPLLVHPELIVLRDLLRPPQFVPWAKPVEQLLRQMQRKRLHMAIVVDEFGGVMGICTLEDVLEQIVGEIQDEYEEEGKAIESLPDGSYAVQGATPIAELNQLTGLAVPEDQGFETVAGFVNSLAGAIPAVGDRFTWRGWNFTVSEADRRRALRVRVARPKRTGSAPA
ncbi:MAG TPA: hemolysin family protein [Anaeromyxobacteraceae bacterium]|nr:hemolysin family protein [Anaeromyxobacteraceae bacterium]